MSEKKTPPGPTGPTIEDNDEIMTSSTSIVIDLENLAQTAPKPLDALPPTQSRPMERVTFSNLEALVPDKVKPPPAEELVEKAPQKVTPPADAISVHDVKPPSLFRFVLGGILLLASAIILFVGWRMDWQWSQILDDPNATVRVVLNGPTSSDTEDPSPAEDPAQHVAPETGQLELFDLSVQDTEAGPFLMGTMRNDSNRIHRSIQILVRLADGDNQIFFSKKFRCCEPDNPSVVLAPNQAASFRLPVKLKGRTTGAVRPTAKIEFSMTDIPD